MALTVVEISRRYREKHPEKYKEYQKQYHEAHKITAEVQHNQYLKYKTKIKDKYILNTECKIFLNILL